MNIPKLQDFIVWQLGILLWQFLNADVASVNLWSVDIGVAFLKLLRLT